jgi:hypothetical protein
MAEPQSHTWLNIDVGSSFWLSPESGYFGKPAVENGDAGECDYHCRRYGTHEADEYDSGESVVRYLARSRTCWVTLLRNQRTLTSF